MSEPTHVWVVKTENGHLHGWYYAAAPTKSDAEKKVAKKYSGETVVASREVKNVDHVQPEEVKPVPVGHYSGPLIPD
jgi:hypothetical protein